MSPTQAPFFRGSHKSIEATRKTQTTNPYSWLQNIYLTLNILCDTKPEKVQDLCHPTGQYFHLPGTRIIHEFKWLAINLLMNQIFTMEKSLFQSPFSIHEKKRLFGVLKLCIPSLKLCKFQVTFLLAMGPGSTRNVATQEQLALWESLARVPRRGFGPSKGMVLGRGWGPVGESKFLYITR